MIGGIYNFVFATNVTLEYPAFTRAPSPADMVGQIYTYALSIAGALAIIRVVYGGIVYIISAGNTSKQSDARDIITSAIWGLVLLAGSYLLLNTINPEIVQLKNPNLTPSALIKGTGGQIGVVPSGGFGGISEQSARTELTAGLVQVKPQCSPGQTACATLDNIQQSTVDELLALKQYCDAQEGSSCKVLVNEGTGGSHSETGTLTHANGYKADLNYTPSDPLTSYIESWNKVGPASVPAEIQKGCSTYSCYQSPTGAIYMLEGDHWDVTVPPKK